jgi:hypothetical protein
VPHDNLAAKIREKLATGALPCQEEVKTWAGYGSGQPCRACDDPILPAQVEYELDMPDSPRIRMHFGCYGLWVGELIRHGRRPPPNASNQESRGYSC